MNTKTQQGTFSISREMGHGWRVNRLLPDEAWSVMYPELEIKGWGEIISRSPQQERDEFGIVRGMGRGLIKQDRVPTPIISRRKTKL
ncbi:hypothetical protein ACFL2C_03130 [Patescibacteria group bacterium]